MADTDRAAAAAADPTSRPAQTTPTYMSTPIPAVRPPADVKPCRAETACHAPGCTVTFGLLHWRHYCETCGHAFCAAHCSNYITLEGREKESAVPVCDRCMRVYSNIDFSRTYTVIAPEPDGDAPAPQAVGGTDRDIDVMIDGGDGGGGDRAACRSVPVMVFLHGAGGHRMNSLPQAQTLKRWFRCILIDLPGHGARQHEPLTLESAIRAVAEVLDAESPHEPVILFGYSMGGYLAPVFAARYPHRVRALCIGGCCTIFAKPRPALLLAMGLVYRTLPASTLASLVRRTFGKQIDPMVLAQALERGGCYFGAWDGVVDVMSHSPITASLMQLKEMPVLMLMGEKDFRRDEADVMRCVDHGRLRVIPNASHVAPFSHTAEFNAHIVEWLRDVCGLCRSSAGAS